MSDNAGMINLSHFAVYDISGADAATLMEYACVAKVAGNTPIGKGIYTHFLDRVGGVRSDLTILRLAENRFRLIDGADAGHRDYVWLSRLSEDNGWDVFIEDRSDHMACLGLWGPNARRILEGVADDPSALDPRHFPFATTKEISIQGIPVLAVNPDGNFMFLLVMVFLFGILYLRKARRRSVLKPMRTPGDLKKVFDFKMPTC